MQAKKRLITISVKRSRQIYVTLPFELTDAVVDVTGFLLICHTLTSGIGAGTFLGEASAGFSVIVGSWGFVSVVELTMMLF